MTLAAMSWKSLIRALLVLSLVVLLLSSGCAEEVTVARDAAADEPAQPVQSGLLRKTGRFYQGTIIASDPSIHKTGSGMEMFYTDLDQGCSVLMIWAVAVIGVQRQPPWPVGGLGFA